MLVDAQVLTREGWKPSGEVQPGDETVGYNPDTCRSEWTVITAVHAYPDAEVWRIGNGHWSARVTPNHRWWSEPQVRRAVGRGTICPECGLGWPTARGMETHLGKAHRKRLHEVCGYGGRFVETRALLSVDRIRVAAPADTEGVLGLSVDDAAITGWIMGDGHAAAATGKPVVCPDCGWRPGTGRRPYRGPIHQPGNSVAVHRARKHGLRKWQTEASETAGWDATIYQAKPAQVVRLRALLASVPHTEVTRNRGQGHLTSHEFKLRRSYATDLLKRAHWGEWQPERLVLQMSPNQRSAWLTAMIDAEGHTRDGFTRITQNDGPVADAVRLAVYLEGYRPTFSRIRRQAVHHKPGGHIGMVARPHVAPSMFRPHEELPRQPVWCVTTELGTWTMLQDGHVMLTGNSVAGDRPHVRRLRRAVPQRRTVPAWGQRQLAGQHVLPG